jgi:hypothetical protein
MVHRPASGFVTMPPCPAPPRDALCRGLPWQDPTILQQVNRGVRFAVCNILDLLHACIIQAVNDAVLDNPVE